MIKSNVIGSKSLILQAASDMSYSAGRDPADDGVYHSISGPCQTFDDDKNGIAPIYESIEHPTAMTAPVQSPCNNNNVTGETFIRLEKLPFYVASGLRPKNSINHYSVNTHRSVFSEGWPKPHSVNP